MILTSDISSNVLKFADDTKQIPRYQSRWPAATRFREYRSKVANEV